MNAKPILFWPKPRSDIELHLGRGADDFLVVDTNCDYDLQKLHKLRRETPVFDPFPTMGDHYRDYSDHVIGSDCHCRILGLDACRQVLRALNDPSLTRSSIEDVLLAINQPDSPPWLKSPVAIEDQSNAVAKHTVDWSHLNWKNTALAAVLVFVAALIGNTLTREGSMTAALVAAFVFSLLYICVRTGVAQLFPSARRARRHLTRLAAAAFPFTRSGRSRRTRLQARHRTSRATFGGRAKLTPREP
jgi:hypothetical protein